MADELKILGQSAPSATTETDLYAVPTGKSAIISTFFVCNRSSATATFRLSFDQGGTGTGDADYVYYDTEIPGNDTFAATVGFTLAAGDVARVYASSGNLSFSVFGLERT